MGRIILTTCGTSLFTSNCWQNISGDLSIFKSANIDEKAENEKAYRKFTEGHKNRDSSGTSLAQNFDLNCWNDSSKITWLTAELASLRAITNFFETIRNPLNNGDKIVLLHSDNDEGRFCASVVERVLRDKIGIPCQVERDEIKGLDPQDAGGFNQALGDIWNRYRNEIGEKYIFNLTGGYKGTAIMLGGLAYKMRATAQITVFYLHETSDYKNIAVNGFRNDEFSAGYIDSNTGNYMHTIGALLWQ